MDDMLKQCMCTSIGLAVIQVGEPLRVIVIDLEEKRKKPKYFVNPEIITDLTLQKF